jgi:hypothetical protein
MAIEQNVSVRLWLDEHKGWRTPVRAEGDFHKFANSRTSCCWGQPLGGMMIPKTNIRIAVCAPSPRSKGDKGMLFYDFCVVEEADS